MGSTLYPLASLEQIERTPSREDGIPEDLEEDLRAYGCKLIHQAGILLKQCVFPSHPSDLQKKNYSKKKRKQVAVATAQILFQRFWFVTSMKQFGVGVSNVYVVSKVFN